MTPPPRRAHEFAVGVSFHDVSDRLGNALALEAGYRPPWMLLGGFRPVASGMIAWDGGTYGFVGIRRPVSIGSGETITPSLGVGAYGAGDRTDLGSVLEFRSGITMNLDMAGARPIEVSFYHLSNAGLQHPNPGIEVLGASYTMSW